MVTVIIKSCGLVAVAFDAALVDRLGRRVMTLRRDPHGYRWMFGLRVTSAWGRLGIRWCLGQFLQYDSKLDLIRLPYRDARREIQSTSHWLGSCLLQSVRWKFASRGDWF